MIKVTLSSLKKDSYENIEKKLISKELEEVNLRALVFLNKEEALKLIKKIRVLKDRFFIDLKEEDVFLYSLYKNKKTEVYARYLYHYSTLVLLRFAKSNLPFSKDFYDLINDLNAEGEDEDEDELPEREGLEYMLKDYYLTNKLCTALKCEKAKNPHSFIDEMIKYIK